jgi:hypothetical protein
LRGSRAARTSSGSRFAAVLRDPDRFPNYKFGTTTAGEMLVGPGVLTAGADTPVRAQ